jgi:hypothetical protein
VILVLLTVMLYPALFLGLRVAPEASLRSVPPWRLQWGPHPEPSPEAIAAATSFGPRLAGIARYGLGLALWNPFIGGGRPGWLAGSREGGTPLATIAGLLAAPGWVFTALFALEIACAAGVVLLVLSRLGCSPGAAGIGAAGYALSGAVATRLLSASGSALALGPLALLPALAARTSFRRNAAAWGGVAALILAAGPEAVPYLVAGVVLAVIRPPMPRGRVLMAIAVGLLLGAAIAAPRFALRPARHEPGAPEVAPRLSPPVRSVAAFFYGPSTSGAATTNHEARPTDAMLGLPLILLAIVGMGIGAPRQRRIWLPIAAAGVAAELLPAAALLGLGLRVRPFGLAALGVGGLAAAGADHLAARAPARSGRFVFALLFLLVLVDLVPGAARHVFFAGRRDATLGAPLPASATADGSRAAPLLENMPPDIAETLGVPDVRATDLSAEPRYEAALGGARTGILPVSAALSPSLRRLGVRWLVEPLPLRVVEAEIFSAIVDGTASSVSRRGDQLRYAIDVPSNAIRVGIGRLGAAGFPPPRLAAGGVTRTLRPDATLAGESAAWHWFAVPDGWLPGPAVLELHAAPRDAPTPIDVAWDESDLRVDRETMGARIWRCGRAVPFASASGGGGEVTRFTRSSDRVDAEVRSTGRTTVTLLVKFRPSLWAAYVDGRRVPTTLRDAVWTAVSVPSGVHRLELVASLARPIWALSVAGLLAIASLAWSRRSR